MNHTPGPWELQGQWQLKTHTGEWVEAECIEAPKWGIIGAWIDSSSDERVANARLIAAAPELLAALKQCTGVLRTWCVTKDEEQVINNAEALVAKAEGRGG